MNFHSCRVSVLSAPALQREQTVPQYRSLGRIPHKRHTLFHDGSEPVFEEMFTLQGFEDIYSLLYHRAAPTELLEVLPTENIAAPAWPDAGHRHHLLNSLTLQAGGTCLQSRRPLLFNEDLVIATAAPDRSDAGFFRNALCDEMICVEAGTGELHTPFGLLPYEPGDLIVVPRGTTQQWHLAEGVPHRFFIVESRSTITPPARYLSRLGQFSFRSPICERDVKAPQFRPPVAERGRYRLSVKTGDELTGYIYAVHPFDVVGWDGYLYPYAINMRDFEPVTRRIHTMPDEQQIFETGGAAICCLVPRLLEYHPDAIPAPPFHSSIDVDEVIFNMGDKFMGWKGGSNGMITFHPRGIVHGSKPGGYLGSIGMKEFDGTAIMVDAARPLRLTAFARECDDPQYPAVWQSDPQTQGAS